MIANRMISYKNVLRICLLFSLLMGKNDILSEIISMDKERIISKANIYMKELPVTITEYTCARSNGGVHDFYSEGDYWWPNPDDPDGPYIRRDGMSNPENFDDHRRVMIQLSIQVPTLVAAYKITGNMDYAGHALKHLKAWFINEETKMNPSLNYAQAIKGRVPGRGVGIIDTIHLVEVVRAIKYLEKARAIEAEDLKAIKLWFSSYLEWLTTHEYGIDEMKRRNNHGTCWVMQVASFADLVGDEELIRFSIDRFKNVLVPNQIDKNGSFPLELERTKPYGYSLFNLDAFAIVIKILEDYDSDLWAYETENNGSVASSLAYMFPYIKNKATWNLPPDVMYFDKFPVRQPSLLFGGLSLGKQEYIDLWKTLDPDPQTKEVIRNFPVRQPVIWLD